MRAMASPPDSPSGYASRAVSQPGSPTSPTSPTDQPLIRSVAVLAMRTGDEENESELVRQKKREAAIEMKEQEYEKKRAADESRKRKELEELIKQEEEDNARKREEHLHYIKSQAILKAQKKEREAKKQQKRKIKIRNREAEWHKKATAEVLDVVNEHRNYLSDLEAKYQAAREEKQAQDLQKMIAEAEEEEYQSAKDQKREENNAKRHMERQVRAALRTDDIKEEARAELESFILNPFPVPLKQVICGKMRPVPTITELLASMKDQKEELQALEEQDLVMRATLRKMSLFEYVHDMQAEADRHRISPPQPVMSDLAKTAVKKPASPKNAKGRSKGGSASPSATARGRFGGTGGRFKK